MKCSRLKIAACSFFANVSCLMCQYKDGKVIEQKLNKNCLNVLSIHFGKVRLKVFCLAQKKRLKKDNNLDISPGLIQVNFNISAPILGTSNLGAQIQS